MSSFQGSWLSSYKVLKPFLIHSISESVSMCLFSDNSVNMWDISFFYFAGTGVTTYSLHPGVIQTELGRHFWPKIPLWKRIVYKPLMFLIKTPKEGAQTTIHCAVEESLQNENGLYYRSVSVDQ